MAGWVQKFARDALIWRCCSFPLKRSNQSGFCSLSPVPRVSHQRGSLTSTGMERSGENLPVPRRHRQGTCLTSLCVTGQELTCCMCVCVSVCSCFWPNINGFFPVKVWIWHHHADSILAVYWRISSSRRRFWIRHCHIFIGVQFYSN